MADRHLDWVEIRSAGHMGDGLFATKDIPRGTRIIAETPILKIPTCSEGDSDILAFCNALHQLPKGEWRQLDQLFCNASLISTTTRAKARQWYKDQGFSDPDGKVLGGKRLQDVAKAATKRFAIFLTNRVDMGPGGMYGNGLFLLHSRINHSCVPNAHNAYNPTIKCLTIHTTRDISTNEQIFVSYINSACRTRQQRQLEIEKWGFECSCPACIDPSIDLLRKRTLVLDQRLAAYESPYRQMEAHLPPGARKLLPAMPTSISEALQNAEELGNLLMKQGLQGMSLCHAYRDCARYSLEIGSISKAIEYARSELNIERLLIGTETDHLRDELNGAEYWLAHLEQKSGSPRQQ